MLKRFLAAALLVAASGLSHSADNLLNVSYDVSREFYKDINTAFSAHYKAIERREVTINQSHGGSSAQARAVRDGLEADVVTMNTTTDIEFLAANGLVASDWPTKFPNGASPTRSTMIFLTRKGNPKAIRDWNDLIRPGVQVVVVNPKTGGNGRMAYLAAWGQVKRNGGSDDQALEFVSRLYRNVPVLAKGGRDATNVFLQRGVGDVLITFESEVLSVIREFGEGKVDSVYPSVSIIAENPVAIVERTVNRRGTAALAKAYLDFLYTEQAQEIAARHALRPVSEAVLAKHREKFGSLRLFAVSEVFGSLLEAQKTHFNDGGVFDRIYTVR
jgi:sulfate transport system substrate-binding protein